MLRTLIIAGAGGFAGTVLRYLVSKYIQESSMSLFPWATFIVNITGCLVIGIIYGISEKGSLMSDEVKLFFTVGLCGGFTTFSSFSNDTFLLLQDKEYLKIVLYTTLSFGLGLLAVYFGRIISKLI